MSDILPQDTGREVLEIEQDESVFERMGAFVGNIARSPVFKAGVIISSAVVALEAVQAPEQASPVALQQIVENPSDSQLFLREDTLSLGRSASSVAKLVVESSPPQARHPLIFSQAGVTEVTSEPEIKELESVVSGDLIFEHDLDRMVANAGNPELDPELPEVKAAKGAKIVYDALGIESISELTPGWQVAMGVLPGANNEGVFALAYVNEKVIVLNEKKNMSAEFAARVLAHEIGHALDLTVMDDAQRNEYLELRNIEQDKHFVWFPNDSKRDDTPSDFATGTGDYAEEFAKWAVGDVVKVQNKSMFYQESADPEGVKDFFEARVRRQIQRSFLPPVADYAKSGMIFRY